MKSILIGAWTQKVLATALTHLTKFLVLNLALAADPPCLRVTRCTVHRSIIVAQYCSTLKVGTMNVSPDMNWRGSPSQREPHFDSVGIGWASVLPCPYVALPWSDPGVNQEVASPMRSSAWNSVFCE